MDPAFFEGAVNNVFFDLLDGDRRLVDSQHAGGFARRRTDASGELGEIIRRVQRADGFFPASVIHEIIPVGNDVVDWASGVAERDATIHASRALGAKFFFGEVLIDFEPVVYALDDRAACGVLARELHESGVLTHGAPALLPRPEPAAEPPGCIAAANGLRRARA